MDLRSESNLKQIHPKLVEVIKAASATSPIPFVVTDGLRTTEQQQKLYAQERTTSGSIVTNADGVNNKSNHQAKTDGYGYAVDLYAAPNESVKLNDTASLKTIATHILNTAKKMSVNVEWGGNWTSLKDYPHFELKT